MPTSGYDLRDAPEIQVTHWYWEEGNEKLNNARYCELWLPIVKRSQNSTTGKTGVREKNIPALFAAEPDTFISESISNPIPGRGWACRDSNMAGEHFFPCRPYRTTGRICSRSCEESHLGIAQGGMKFNAVPGHIGVRPGGAGDLRIEVRQPLGLGDGLDGFVKPLAQTQPVGILPNVNGGLRRPLIGEAGPQRVPCRRSLESSVPDGCPEIGKPGQGRADAAGKFRLRGHFIFKGNGRIADVGA